MARSVELLVSPATYPALKKEFFQKISYNQMPMRRSSILEKSDWTVTCCRILSNSRYAFLCVGQVWLQSRWYLLCITQWTLNIHSVLKKCWKRFFLQLHRSLILDLYKFLRMAPSFIIILYYPGYIVDIAGITLRFWCFCW